MTIIEPCPPLLRWLPAKALLFKDAKTAAEILKNEDAAEIKAFERRVSPCNGAAR